MVWSKMGRIGDPMFLAIFLSTFVASCFAIEGKPTANVSYAIVTSDVLVPGSELLIDLHLLDLIKSDSKKGGNEPNECVLDLSVSSDDHLWHRSAWKIELEEHPKSFSKTLRILLSDERSLGDKSVLKVESTSCFKFSRSVEVPTGRRELMVSIRTDKLNYRPGDIVWIEAFVFTADHRPYWKPLNLSIYDSKDVLTVRWLDVLPSTGLIKESYLIPKLTKTRKLVLVAEIEKQQVNYTVNVEHLYGAYDKEFFQIEVICPEYVTVGRTDEGRNGHWNVCVIANDNFGVPINGRVGLDVSLKNEFKSVSLSPLELHGGHKTISLKLDEIKEILGITKEESLVGHEIQVRVKVDEIRPSRDERISGDETEDEKKEKEGSDKQEVAVSVVKDVNVKFVNQSLVLFFGETSPLFFKPGLSYVGHILLKPVDELASIGLPEKEVTIIIKHYVTHPEKPVVQNITKKLPLNSYGEFSFHTQEKDVRIEIEALVKDDSTGGTVKARLENICRFSAEHEKTHFIQVKLQDSTVKMIDQEIKAVIETTFPSIEIAYFLFSHKSLILSGRISAPSPSTKHELSLVVPQNVSRYISTPDLLVQTLAPNKEIITDSIRFVLLQPQQSELQLSVSRQIAEPGSEVEIVVRGETHTHLHIMVASDVLPFETKELERQKLFVYDRMRRYLHTLNSTHLRRTHAEFCINCYLRTSLAPDSRRVFNETGALLITDGVLFEDPNYHPSHWQPNGTLDDIRTSTLDCIGELNAILWNSTNIGKSGELKLKLNLPMAAKLYTVSVVGVRPGKDLMIVDEPIQVLATSKVLASLRHLESVVRGEVIMVEVNLFNNQDKEAKVKVTLRSRPGHQTSNQDGKKGEENQFRREVILKPKQLEVVPFHVKTSPTVQEPLEFQVEVVSDEVHHKLNSSVDLKYQGYEVVASESLILNNFRGDQVLDVDVPKNINNPIQKSERGRMKIYGHPLGPAVEHVCSNLKRQDALEERTKIGFVLAVNVLEHISNNSLFDNSVHINHKDAELPVNASLDVPVDKEECIQSVRDSLQYLLNKRRDDGSYSFYPQQHGYIWLTSLMLDSTVLLRNVVFWNKEDVAETVKWLAKQQKEDGSFVEDKNAVVLRMDLQDEESQDVPLTSHVVVILLEASNQLHLSEEEAKLVESVTNRSVEYLEKVILKGYLDQDPYSLNLAAYALALARSDIVYDVLRKRDKLTVYKGDEGYFKIDDEKSMKESSISVESTSYAILTSLAMNDLNTANSFVNFLLRAMRPDGMFVSAQDSHVALKALSQYFRLYNVYHEQAQVNVDVSVILSNNEQLSFKVLSPFFVGSLYFDHSNLSLSSSLKVESTGEGIVLVQSVSKFNEAIPPFGPTSFDLKVEVKQKYSESLKLKVCAINLEMDPGVYLIGEVPLISGYELNLEKQEGGSNPQFLKQDDEVYLIFSGVPSKGEVCAELVLDRIYRIGHPESRFVKLYPVLNPGHSIRKPYQEP